MPRSIISYAVATMFFSNLPFVLDVRIIGERATGNGVGAGAGATVGPRTLSLTYLLIYLGCLERRSEFEEPGPTIVIHVVIRARRRFGRHA